MLVRKRGISFLAIGIKESRDPNAWMAAHFFAAYVLSDCLCHVWVEFAPLDLSCAVLWTSEIRCSVNCIKHSGSDLLPRSGDYHLICDGNM